ncbi:plant UBX domain-containing protein 8-like isoform X2 [Salvia splendens]|uniref:plant UBX domain-containing protein 8-like isoform X2 n=1 Tax=Salvia splendens TaxID=180675 RepID=UPI001C2670B2|nr:plant UBX domain-containing protein 8-like isoform X2 [Salvia splendens]
MDSVGRKTLNEEHLGNLNEAVNAHFTEGDRNLTQQTSFTSSRAEGMDIDDPMSFESNRPPPSLLPFGRDLNPFSLLDPNCNRSIYDRGDASNRTPFVSHPREVREIPIGVKDETGATGRSVGASIIEDVTGSTHGHGTEVRGTVIIDDDEPFPILPPTRAATHGTGYSSRFSEPSAPTTVDLPDYGNDIEEEMIRAAIEASKQEAGLSSQDSEDPAPVLTQSHPEDAEFAHVVSLSLQTAEREKALREREGKALPSGEVQISGTSDEVGILSANGRQSQLEVGSTTLPDEAEDVEDLPLVRRRRRFVSSAPIDTAELSEDIDDAPPSSPPPENNVPRPHQIRSEFPSDEWGGISSVEHDEAVMLEAAMFGGIPEGGGYNFPHAPHHLSQNGLGVSTYPYPRHNLRPPSPSLTAQRLIREQQDDEYLASLQADREKELKAKEEAEAALAEEKLREEAMHRKLQEEQEKERQLAAKEASLPGEPTPDDENAVTLLVRMPDGSRRGRRFLKSDKLQSVFDYIDIGRVVKPGSYRLVRPYPRRAFGDGESPSTLDELGLTSKQEALYLELI